MSALPHKSLLATTALMLCACTGGATGADSDGDGSAGAGTDAGATANAGSDGGTTAVGDDGGTGDGGSSDAAPDGTGVSDSSDGGGEAVCGNGRIEADEACDPPDPARGCTAACVMRGDILWTTVWDPETERGESAYTISVVPESGEITVGGSFSAWNGPGLIARLSGDGTMLGHRTFDAGPPADRGRVYSTQVVDGRTWVAGKVGERSRLAVLDDFDDDWSWTWEHETTNASQTESVVFNLGTAYAVTNLLAGAEVSEFDPDGEIVWTWSDPTPASSGGMMHAVADGLLLLQPSGDTPLDYFAVCKIGFDGQEQWCTEVPETLAVSGWEASAAYDNGLIVVGYGADAAFGARVSADGQLLWMVELASHADNGYANSVAVGPGGRLFVAGGWLTAWLAEFDPADGSLVWARSYDDLASINAIAAPVAGEIVSTGYWTLTTEYGDPAHVSKIGV